MNMGINGYFGSGRQYYSWIHIEDMANMILYAIQNTTMQGTYNAASPQTLRNKEFQSIVATAYGKNAILLPTPTFILRPVLGQMLSLLTMSSNTSANKILSHGYKFMFPDLDLVELVVFNLIPDSPGRH